MPEHLSIPQLAGVAALALACAAWLFGLTRVLRRGRPGTGARGFGTNARPSAGRARRSRPSGLRLGSDGWRRHPGIRPSDPAAARSLPALPRQRQAVPHLETVELTPAEKAAFAGLVRQLSDGR